MTRNTVSGREAIAARIADYREAIVEVCIEAPAPLLFADLHDALRLRRLIRSPRTLLRHARRLAAQGLISALGEPRLRAYWRPGVDGGVVEDLAADLRYERGREASLRRWNRAA